MVLLTGFGLIFSCSKDVENPQKNEENELITTIRIQLKDSLGNEKTAVWRDLTPNDDADRRIDTLFLTDSTEYSGTIEFWDETKNPIENLTEEIRKEGKDHLVVYKPNAELTASQLEVIRTDKDFNNLEIGLSFILKTRWAANGKLRVILRHQPGEKNGTETPGDSDVDVEFPVFISR